MSEWQKGKGREIFPDLTCPADVTVIWLGVSECQTALQGHHIPLWGRGWSSQQLGGALQSTDMETFLLGRWRDPFQNVLSFLNCKSRPQEKSTNLQLQFYFFLESETEGVIIHFMMIYVKNKVSFLSMVGMYAMQLKSSCQVQPHLRLWEQRLSPQMETMQWILSTLCLSSIFYLKKFLKMHELCSSSLRWSKIFFLDWMATYLLIAVKFSTFFCIKWNAN